MKKLIMTAAILGLTATGAAAQSATNQQDINLTATVAAYCTMGAPSLATIDFTGGSNGGINAAPQSANLAVVCNNAAKITLTSARGAMVSDADGSEAGLPVPPTGFANKIEYTAQASGSGFTPVTLDTSGPTNSTGPTNNTTGAINATLSVEVTPTTPGNPLLAATYKDTLTIKIEPQ